jgi:hypothetical protein
MHAALLLSLITFSRARRRRRRNTRSKRRRRRHGGAFQSHGDTFYHQPKKMRWRAPPCLEQRNLMRRGMRWRFTFAAARVSPASAQNKVGRVYICTWANERLLCSWRTKIKREIKLQVSAQERHMYICVMYAYMLREWARSRVSLSTNSVK